MAAPRPCQNTQDPHAPPSTQCRPGSTGKPPPLAPPGSWPLVRGSGSGRKGGREPLQRPHCHPGSHPLGTAHGNRPKFTFQELTQAWIQAQHHRRDWGQRAQAVPPQTSPHSSHHRPPSQLYCTGVGGGISPTHWTPKMEGRHRLQNLLAGSTGAGSARC